MIDALEMLKRYEAEEKIRAEQKAKADQERQNWIDEQCVKEVDAIIKDMSVVLKCPYQALPFSKTNFFTLEEFEYAMKLVQTKLESMLYLCVRKSKYTIEVFLPNRAEINEL